MLVPITFLFSVLLRAASADISDNPIQYCGDFKPQNIVEVDKLFGKWYVIELIFHAKEENEIVKYHSECPTVFLSEDTPSSLLLPDDFMSKWTSRQNSGRDQDTLDELMKSALKVWNSPRDDKSVRRDGHRQSTSTISPEEELQEFRRQSLQRLRLLWNEEGNRVEYALRYNPDSPGLWMSFGSHNGSGSMQQGYEQFVGTVQVMRAVYDHVVLTFCHVSVPHQFYTLVAAREPWLSRRELHGVRALLHQRRLPVRHVRSMCLEYQDHASAATPVPSTTAASLLTLLLLALYTCR